MGAEADQLQNVTHLPVDQHQIGLDVAIAMVIPFAGKLVVAMAFGQRRIDPQETHDLGQERADASVGGIRLDPS